MFDIEGARNYVRSTVLSEKLVTAQDTEAVEDVVFSTAKNQATIIKQDVFAFMSGTEDVLRKAISDSSLLAQLVADKKIEDKDDLTGWYDAYFEVLRNIGWVVQDQGWAVYEESGDGFEVHEKIAEVASVLLGPAPAALAVVKATLDALTGMNDDSPWITFFNRETTESKAARFQISLVQPEAGGLVVSMMAFSIKAKRKITQVLFFKIKDNSAVLRNKSATVSINVDALKDLSPLIDEKTRAFQRDYFRSLPELG